MAYKNNDGFTLIELSFVVILLGLSMITVVSALKMYTIGSHEQRTYDAMVIARGALGEFQAYNGRYPCPADPTLSPSHEDYGFEDCDGPNIADVEGGRPVDASLDRDGRILIGALPFATLQNLREDPDIIGIRDAPLVENHATDAWGNKLTYAVSKDLTRRASFHHGLGAIDVRDERDLPVLSEESTAHIVMVSHGQNGRGAYTRGGVLVEPCFTGTYEDEDENPDLPPPTGGFRLNERENCDNLNHIFLSGLRYDQERLINDDIVLFMTNSASSLWQYTNLGAVANTNIGNVGIGTQTPTATLHIDGDLRAEKLHARIFCDDVGRCMPASVIAGEDPNMRCSNPGEAIVAIDKKAGSDNITVTCEQAFPNSIETLPKTICDSGQVMVGVSNIHGVICAPRP
jgi:type II secretory pathway pseudopilin PulG